MSVIWLTGLSGAGKSTVAEKLAIRIGGQIVDGDMVRRSISSDLKPGQTDRKEHYRRVINYIKSILNDSQSVIATFVSPEKHQRDWIKTQFDVAGIPFYEIYIKASLQTCEKRDVKGLYSQYRRGNDIKLAGLTEEYEEPDKPAAVCNTDRETLEECVSQILVSIGHKVVDQ